MIIVWAFDGSDVGRDRETLYVGMSRAKSVLYVCGSREAFDRILMIERYARMVTNPVERAGQGFCNAAIGSGVVAALAPCSS